MVFAASFENDNGEYFRRPSAIVSRIPAMRFAMMDRSIDGYNENSAPNAARPNMPATDETIFRIGAQWEPEATSVSFSLYIQRLLAYGKYRHVTKFGPTIVDGVGPVAGVKRRYVRGDGIWLSRIGESITDAYRDGLSIGAEGIGDTGSERLDGTDTQNKVLAEHRTRVRKWHDIELDYWRLAV